MTNFLRQGGTPPANSVTTAMLQDDAVTTAKIADDAVVQASIADESINEARLQVSNSPTNGQFLQCQSGNTGGLTWAAAGGGGWEFVSSATASSSASVSFTGMESGYSYLIEAYDIVPASDNTDLFLKYGTGATPTYQTSNYMYVTGGINNTNKSAAHSTSDSKIKLVNAGGGTSTSESFMINLEIINPADSGSHTMLFGSTGGRANDTFMVQYNVVAQRAVDESVSAVQVYFDSSVNMTTGKFFFYRRANS